jgi:hypothetical protein
MHIPEGCILLARKTQESDIWVIKPSWWLKVWTYILMKVNHTDNKYFKRGENMFSRKEIHLHCHLSMDGVGIEAIANLFRYLRENGMIHTQKTTRGIVIKVTNYDEYQKLENYKPLSKNHTGNHTDYTQTTHRLHTINKNVKNEKNEYTTILSQAETLLATLPSNIQYLFREYIEIMAAKNKTGKIVPSRKARETMELYQLYQQTEDKSIFEFALLEACKHHAAALNYVKAVIRNKESRATQIARNAYTPQNAVQSVKEYQDSKAKI